MKIFLLTYLAVVSVTVFSQTLPGDGIRLNQLGFYENAPKMAVVLAENANSFQIIAIDTNKPVFAGVLSEVKSSSYSPRKTRIADFSSYATPGEYFIVVPGAGSSYPFTIGTGIHAAVAKSSLKAFYFQRFSTQISKKFAGQWSRPASPSHNAIVIHPSAASDTRPAGSTIRSPRGWIDAGDYNKYIVNSGITTATLLSAYEDFPMYYDTLKTNIPESSNKLPDIIDEVLWNLRWMLTMQDPADGGVYHKCTNAKFDPMVMPDQATTTRYVVQKSTAAALNLAAVGAQASRVLKKFESALPGLADTCLRASKSAFQWALQHPDVLYNQKKMNEQFDPDVTTGEYGDGNVDDEFFWAAAEIAVTTNDFKYLETAEWPSEKSEVVPSWNQVAVLGYYAIMKIDTKASKSIQARASNAVNTVLKMADQMVKNSEASYYQVVMGASARDFVWGSNAVAANQSMLLLKAFLRTSEARYLDAALTNLDYILGRNATGYCYVTGVGDKSPKHPHHRPSEADGVGEPVPGLLAGGPNPGQQDKCAYTSSVPDESYVDDVCSYASNEIAINWNAPLVYITGGIESLQLKFSPQPPKK